MSMVKSIQSQTASEIALRICPKSRVFSGGEIQIFATSEQFEAFVTALVADRTKRILDALDCMDHGCRDPGFQGHENGLGDEKAGDQLQAAREELVRLVGHVKVPEPVYED